MTKNKNRNKNNQKIFYITLNILPFLILITSLFWLNWGKNQYINIYSNNEHKELMEEFEVYQKDTEKQLKSYLNIVSNNKELKKHFINKDREGLYLASKRTFYDLLENKHIDRLNFTDPQGKVFLRIQNKSLYGDTIKRKLYKLAAKSKKIESGLEMGKTGLSIRALAPYYGDDKKLIGYMEVGENIDCFIKDLQKPSNNLYFIVLDKNELGKDEISFINDEKYNSEYLTNNNLVFLKTDNQYFDYIKKISKELINSKSETFNNVRSEVKIENNVFILGAFPLIDTSNKHIAHIVYLMDITDFHKKFDFIKYIMLLFFCLSTVVILLISRKLSEHSKVELFEKNLADIIENSFNEIVIIDPEDFSYIYLNKKVLKDTGYEFNELVGRPISETTPFSYETARKTVNPLFTGEAKTLTYETTRIRKNGTSYPIQVNLQLMEMFDKKVLVAICENISERKEEERIKNEFISMVSHELRTPLTSIMGVLGLLLNTNFCEDITKTKGLLNIAHSNSTRLLNLVNDILDMQKIEAGKVEFNIEKLNLNKVVKKLIELNTSYADKYHVSLTFSSELGENIFINADNDRLSQSITNLLSNAIKFSPVNETVNITLKKINGFARISIEDKGKGISEEARKKIYKKFSQVDSSSTRSKDGTGLGLYITKHLIEKMNGKIDFESEVGKGTSFYIDFPIVEIGETLHE